MDYFESRDSLPFDIIPDDSNGENRIRDSFKGATVFITGATGFLGKLLLEKILRSCPEVKKIFLLLREKKNVKPKERIVELFKEPVMEKVRRQFGAQILEKVIPLSGDCSEERLGLSVEDEEQALNSDYIFHAAASLNMDEPIIAANRTNVTATKELLELATHMQNLRAFIYVSTAYCHTREKLVKEDFYDITFKQEDIKNMEKTMLPEQIGALAPKILDDSPNTYSFTKKIAEDVVRSYKDRVPLSIIRPSIVVGCYKEPLAGWIGSVNGATGVVLAAALGLIRVWAGHQNLIVDIVPADMFVNCTIVSAWKRGEMHLKKKALGNCPIYNYVSSRKAPTTWNQYMKLNEWAFYSDNLFLSDTIRPYDFRVEPNFYLYIIKMLYHHVLPGILIDSFRKLTGKKPKLIRAFKKIHRFNLKLYYFCMNEWEFHDFNIDALAAELSPKEKDIYPFDLTGFKWESFITTAPRGMRAYLMKDPMENKQKAQVYYKRLYRIFMAANILKYSVASWLLYKYLESYLAHYYEF